MDLIQNVDITIQGAAFEKAVDQYTRRIKTELFAADHAKGCCADVKVYCRAPSRKKGDPDTLKSFSADAVRHPSTKKAFNSQVKTSTVAHRSITLELLFRTCMFKVDNTVPKSTPEKVDKSVVWKFIRVKRNFTLHFQQQEKGWMNKEKTSGKEAKPGSTRSFAELPGISLALGVFLDPGGEVAANNYMSLFASQIPQARAAREKKISKIVVEDMGKKESDVEAVRKAAELLVGGDDHSTIFNYPIFDPIMENLRQGIQQAVTRRDDFRAFSLCLPVSLLCGRKKAFRDCWRMMGGMTVRQSVACCKMLVSRFALPHPTPHLSYPLHVAGFS